VMVSYHMSEWRTFRSELAAPRSDVAVLVCTFVLTVAVDLTVAIQVGMVLSAMLFMRRMAEVTNVTALTREMGEDEGEDANPLIGRVPQGVAVYAIDGPFFFGAAEKFRETMGTVEKPPRVLVIQMRRVPAIDSTGIRALGSVIRRARGDGTRVILAGVHAQPMVALGRSALLDEVGDENLTGTLEGALELARGYVERVGGAPAPRVADVVDG
jgi:sulfate permease, SulP family